MSRKIIFRAWDKKNNIMAYPNDDGEYSFIDDMDERVRSDQDLFSIISCLYKDIIPMQFTGLKDKSDKEIYEGDIVRKESYSTGYCLPIVWRDCMFQLGYDGISPLYDETQFEIIGNIYENPDLIPKTPKKLL